MWGSRSYKRDKGPSRRALLAARAVCSGVRLLADAEPWRWTEWWADLLRLQRVTCNS